MMSQTYRSTAGVLLASLVAGGCSDVAVTAPTALSAPASNAFTRLAAPRAGTRYGCMASERDPLAPGRYRYSRLSLHVPSSLTGREGYLRYHYRAGSDPAAPDAAANCLIPNTSEAIAFLDRHLAHGRGRRVTQTTEVNAVQEDLRTSGRSSQDQPIGGYQLPTVYVYEQYNYTYAGSYEWQGGV